MFDIQIIKTDSLGDRSYFLSDGKVAAVIDPQRDIDRVLAIGETLGVHITHVLETHLHNDYVTGGLELSRTVGARYLMSGGDDVTFDRIPVSDGDVVSVGAMRLRVMSTPGHTHHHVSYVLQNSAGVVEAVFTGGSMLYGSTGRTDLAGPEHTADLAHAQFHSARRLAAELPPTTRILPTHGFGSFCSATPTSGDESTIAEQGDSNPALTQNEQTFVDQLIDGLGAYPAYYAHMAPLNSAGPAAVDLSMPTLVDVPDLLERIEAGQWVIDLREGTAFAAGHVRGTLSFELSEQFATYFGWLYPWDTPVTLLGNDQQQILAARRELVRIGIDRLTGAALGEPTAAMPTSQTRSYPVGDFAGLAAAMGTGKIHILDVRNDEERDRSAIPGSQHIPLHRLPERRGQVPTGPVWVHCGSGYRAAIAASMLEEDTRQVVHINDAFTTAETLGLTRPGR